MRKQVVDVGKLKWYTAQPIEVGWSNHPSWRTIIIFWLLYIIGYLWMLWPQNRNWRRNVISMTSIFITHLNSQFGFETLEEHLEIYAIRCQELENKDGYNKMQILTSPRFFNMLHWCHNKNPFNLIWIFSYSTWKNSSTGKRWKVDIRNGSLEPKDANERCAPPACLVALILIPHGAAFLDGFSMRNVISGDFCVAVAHWLQFLHFLLQFPKIESKKSFWLKKVGESFSKLNFFLKLCFWTKIRFGNSVYC